VFPSQIEELVLSFPALAPHFEVQLTRPDRMDIVQIRLETRAQSDEEMLATLASAVAHRVKALIGISARIHILPPGTLPRSQGKAARVTDLR
jgi:phenylacetate-CoA ligase